MRVHVKGPVLVHDEEIAYTRTAMARFFSKVLRQPIPAGVDFQPMALDGGPFGAFARSRPLTDDGRIVAVATPGHTPGHVSVICIDDDGRHVMLAGDTHRHARAAACPPRRRGRTQSPPSTVATMETILAHAREHPTVYLPSHDPESVARLDARTTVEVA